MESIKINGQDVQITDIQTQLGDKFSLVSAEALQTEIDSKLSAQRVTFEEQKSKIETAHGQTWKDRMQGIEGEFNSLGFSQKEGETGLQYAQRLAKDYSELKKTLETEKTNLTPKTEDVKAGSIDYESKYKEELNKNTISNAALDQNNAAMKTLQDRLTSLDNEAIIAKKTAYTKSFVDKLNFSKSLTDGSIVAFKKLATDALNNQYDGIKEIDGVSFFEKSESILPTFNADDFLNELDFIKDNLHKGHEAKGVNSAEELNKLKDSKAVSKADYPLTVNPQSRNDIVANGKKLGIETHVEMAEYLKKHAEYVSGKLKINKG